MKYPKATRRVGGIKMMTVVVKHAIGLYHIAGIFAHDAYDASDFPTTKAEAWNKVMRYLQGHSIDGVWDDVSEEIEAAAVVRARELFPELEERSCS